MGLFTPRRHNVASGALGWDNLYTESWAPHWRGQQKLTTDETSESVNFSRPFFAEVHRMDHANYLAPCWSVGGISVGSYRNDAPTLGVSEPNALMPGLDRKSVV